MSDNNQQIADLQAQLAQLQAQQANTTIPTAASTQQAVLVRNTATGGEQAIAAVAGLLTAGPLGALASWGALRGLQGKWAPWFVLGIPAAPILGLVQFGVLGALMAPSTDYTPSNPEPTSIEQAYTAPSTTSSSLPSFNQPRNGGETTLVSKCQRLATAQEDNDFGSLMELSFQIGFEHDASDLSVDEACSAVGVNTAV